MATAREPLTERQEAIANFIASHSEKHGYPPTIREIGEAFGIRSTNGVNDHLKALERKGYLDRGASKSRALVLRAVEGGKSGTLKTPPARNDYTIEIPLLGRVAAGAPILAEENIDERLHLDASMLPRSAQAVFALRVQGDSMIGDGIFDGDLVFVRKQSTARDGQIAVVLVENEATVKRIYREEGRVRLQPSNPRLSPIYLEEESFRDSQVIGTVVGVFRRV